MRIAIFGMGSIGQRHATNLREMGGHELLLSDPFKQEYGVTAEAVWDWKPEAVLICTPPDAHYALALNAIRKKVHVFIEKPITTSAHEADVLQWEAKNFGVQLAVAYQLRWQLGHIPGNADLSWDCRQDMRQWASRYEKDVLMEFSHEIDAATFIHGPVEAVTASTNKWGWRVILRHIQYVSCITICPYAVDEYRRTCHSTYGELWAFDQAKNDQAYKDELTAFLDVCRGGPWDDRLCSGAEAAHVVRIIEAAKESARDCKVVSL